MNNAVTQSIAATDTVEPSRCINAKSNDKNRIRGIWNQNDIIKNTLPFLKGINRTKHPNEIIVKGKKMDSAFAKFINTFYEITNDQHEGKYFKAIFTKALSRHFHGTALHIYGSCSNQLSLDRSSDINFSLTTTTSLCSKYNFQSGRIDLYSFAEQQETHLIQVKNILENIPGVQDCRVINQVRGPVLKGRIMSSGGISDSHFIDFDVSLLNNNGIASSDLINEYCGFGNTRNFLLLVKAWAKVCGIHSASQNTLTSYSLMLLAIFFLQRIDYVPNLQSKEWLPGYKQHTKYTMPKSGICTDFVSYYEVARHKMWKMASKSQVRGLPVSTLFLGFLKFYLGTFPQGFATVSIRTSFMLPKAVFGNFRLWRVCIEDPFETYECSIPNDLGAHIDERSQRNILSMFQKSYTELKHLFDRRYSSQTFFLEKWLNMLDYHNPRVISKELKRCNGMTNKINDSSINTQEDDTSAATTINHSKKRKFVEGKKDQNGSVRKAHDEIFVRCPKKLKVGEKQMHLDRKNKVTNIENTYKVGCHNTGKAQLGNTNNEIIVRRSKRLKVVKKEMQFRESPEIIESQITFKIGDFVRALNVKGKVVKEMNKYVNIEDSEGKIHRKLKRNIEKIDKTSSGFSC